MRQGGHPTRSCRPGGDAKSNTIKQQNKQTKQNAPPRTDSPHTKTHKTCFIPGTNVGPRRMKANQNTTTTTTTTNHLHSMMQSQAGCCTSNIVKALPTLVCLVHTLLPSLPSPSCLVRQTRFPYDYCGTPLHISWTPPITNGWTHA